MSCFWGRWRFPGSEEVTPEFFSSRTNENIQKAVNPTRVGSLARDQPRSLRMTPWSGCQSFACNWLANHTRGEPAKSGLSRWDWTPWRGKYPGELRARCLPNTLHRMADSPAEQHPESVWNAMRGTAPEMACGCGGGTKLCRVDPKSGSGVE